MQLQHSSVVPAYESKLACSFVVAPLRWGFGVNGGSAHTGTTGRRALQVLCSSRNPGRPRLPLWKGRILSSEALRAVRELKRAKEDPVKLTSVFQTTIARLLKLDMLSVLTELQRQNECKLAIQVFELVRKEIWYKPDEGLYSEIITVLGRNSMVEEVEKLFHCSKEEGLQVIVRVYAVVISARLQSGNVTRAMEVYEELKKRGQFPCETVYGVLRKGLESNGETELVARVEHEYREALEDQLVDHVTAVMAQ